MSLVSIATIRLKVRQYGSPIDAPRILLTIRGSSSHFGDPNVEIDDSEYHYAQG